MPSLGRRGGYLAAIENSTGCIAVSVTYPLLPKDPLLESNLTMASWFCTCNGASGTRKEAPSMPDSIARRGMAGYWGEGGNSQAPMGLE